MLEVFLCSSETLVCCLITLEKAWGKWECEQRRRCGFSPCISSWFILKYFSSSFPVSEKHRRSSRVLLGLLIYVDLSAMKTVSTGKVSGGNEEVHRAPDLGR